MILVGSRALTLRAPQALMRKPLDFDWVCTREEYDLWMEKNSHKINPTKIYAQGENKMIVEGSTNCEFELIVAEKSSSILKDLVEGNSESLETPFGWVPTFDMLFTIKSSHKFLKNSPHVWKTLIDYHMMKSLGAKVRPEYEAFLKLRERETYSYKHPSLTNQSKESFFSAAHGVEYTFEHDSLHEAVKHLDMPAYKYYAKDNDPIKSDKKKFFECSPQIRLYGAIEESSVLALERAIIPHPELWTYEKAWKFAFSKVITSITSGFFRGWCYDNAFDILKAYPKDYYEKFQKGLTDGTVRYITKDASQSELNRM